MAKFSVEDLDNYGGQGNGSFFALKNDKDIATVRFMYDTLEDVEGYAVHEVEVDGKKRYVNCLRTYNEPVDNCPLCAAKYKVVPKLFVLLYDVDGQEVKIWDRGKTFYSKLSSLCARYKPLVNTVFEIERNGKKGDTSTTYETYQISTDNTTLNDLPEVPQLLGTLILDKTFEELQFFITNGYFNTQEQQPTRNPATDSQQPNMAEQVRRRPATSTRPMRPESTDKF